MRFLQIIMLAVPAYMVAVAAGIFYCRHYGWPTDYDALDHGQQNMVSLVRYVVWGITLFWFDGWVLRWRARRRAASMPPVIIVGGVSGRPVKRPPGLIQQFINFVIVMALLFFGLLYFVASRH